MIFSSSVVAEFALGDQKERLAHIMSTNIAKNSQKAGERQELISQMNQYEMFKKSYARSMVFDPTQTTLSKLKNKFLFEGLMVEKKMFLFLRFICGDQLASDADLL